MDRGTCEINRREISDTPNKNHITGKAREVVEEMERSIDGEGVYRMLGVFPNSSVLLYGKPGTGKSLAMKVLNNSLNEDSYLEEREVEVGERIPTMVNEGVRLESLEREEENEEGGPETEIVTQRIGANFHVIPYNIGDVGSAYMNMNARKMADFFRHAYQLAEEGQKVLLEFDEVDSLLAQVKGTQGTSEDRKVRNTLRKHIQKAHDKRGVFMAFLSNEPEVCDAASFRSQRVDEKYEFKLPGKEERIEMLQVAVGKIHERAGYEVIGECDYERLADMSDGMSYADIDCAVEKAVRARADELLAQGGQDIVDPGSIGGERIERQLALLKRQNLDEGIGLN